MNGESFATLSFVLVVVSICSSLLLFNGDCWLLKSLETEVFENVFG